MPQAEQHRGDSGSQHHPVILPDQARKHAAEGDLLEQDGADRDEDERGEQRLSQIELVPCVIERMPGQGQRGADRVDQRHPADQDARPGAAAAPGARAKAEILPGKPAPPGDKQQPGGADRTDHQRGMRYPVVDHVDDHQRGHHNREPCHTGHSSQLTGQWLIR